MTTTTVLSEDATTVVSDDIYRFSWSAVFAGALVSSSVILFLLTLGAGVGLSLVSAKTVTATFLTLGAIYFFAAQAFGFAAGGFLTGRLLSPVVETTHESEFRAGSHGLVSWALAVVVTTGLLAAAALMGSGAGALVAATAPTQSDSLSANAAGYWVDVLFRGATSSPHASLSPEQFAQNDDGISSDAIAGEPAPESSSMMPSGAPTTPVTSVPLAAPLDDRSIAGDKAEVSRILVASMADGGRVSSADKSYIAGLVARDAALSRDAAQARVNDTEEHIHSQMKLAADNARKTAMYASLWTALALLFGGVAATVAAMAARWEEDRLPLKLRGAVTRTQV